MVIYRAFFILPIQGFIVVVKKTLRYSDVFF